MARTSSFNNKVNLALALADLDSLTVHYTKELVKLGYIALEHYRIPGSRGKPSVRRVLTGKGRGMVAMSKNWKSVKERTPIMTLSQSFSVDMAAMASPGYEVHIS